MSFPKFHPGEVYITPGATQALKASDQPITVFLNRHLSCDWGELSEEGCKINGDGSGWCKSQYRTRRGESLWIITDHEHSATTIVLQEEY